MEARKNKQKLGARIGIMGIKIFSHDELYINNKPWQNWPIKSNNTTENTTIAITILKRPIRKKE